VVRTGHAVRRAQTYKGQLLKVSTGFLVHSLLHVPILSKGKVLGVLSVDNRISKRAFTEMDEMLLISLADYAAVAIENARLYEQAQQEIAERKRAEAALEKERTLLARRVAERTAELSAANAELARAARLKDEFLASMSHELRTPLNTVLGLSETLQEQLYGPLNKRQHKSLRSIEKSGRHLLALINDILDVSKIEAGKLGLEIGPVSVELVCQASLGLTKQIAQKKRLKVSSSFDSAVEIVQADQRRLKQILVNLLSNAVKFTPEGGAISLEVVGDVEREAVHFTVWDTGIGISPEEMERLFQPFVQLDSSLSRQYTGTGLGLALVRRLTELHGGGVSVESEVGKGSRFTVSLPWQGPAGAVEPVGEPELAEAGTPLAVGAAQRPEAERPLILLAEDNEESINTIQDYLLAKGYRVVVARDGAEAIERAREERPELIVMDIQMPGMDGLEATWRLRAGAAQSVATIPIIALTALAMPGDRERCLAAGANEYLSKPVSLKGLVKVIEVQLNRNQIGKGDLT
jgi:signal transduction histidine kinase/CheY-like chemotaxis protein